MSTIQGENGVAPTNPLNPAETLKRPLDPDHIEEAHPPQPPLEQDSAVTKAEKVERHGFEHFGPDAGPAAKRAKTEVDESPATTGELERKKGSAPIKAEYAFMRNVALLSSTLISGTDISYSDPATGTYQQQTALRTGPKSMLAMPEMHEIRETIAIRNRHRRVKNKRVRTLVDISAAQEMPYSSACHELVLRNSLPKSASSATAASTSTT